MTTPRRTLTALLANSGKTTERIAAEAGVTLSDAYATLNGKHLDDSTTAAIAGAMGLYPQTLRRLITAA